MGGTFATELAARGKAPAYWVTVAGWGRRLRTAAAAPTPELYRFSTLHPGHSGWSTAGLGDAAHTFIPILLEPTGALGEAIDLQEGTTSLGTLSFELLDGHPEPLGADVGQSHGWLSDLVTDLLAHEGPPATSPGRWSMAVDATAGDTTLVLTSVAGLVPGMALWIGGETVWVTAVPGGGGALSIDVVRAVYGTTARAHKAAPYGEGVAYDRPRYAWGRRVELWCGLFDSRAGNEDELLPIAEARRVWTGTLDDWEMPDGNTFRFVCKPAIGGLDTRVGRRRVSGTALPTIAGDVEEQMLAGRTLELQLREALLEGDRDRALPAYPADGSSIRRYHARYGDQLVECQHQGGSHRVTAWGLQGTEVKYDGNKEVAFWDVLCTDPDLALIYCKDGANAATSNPFDLALMLMTSTGSRTWGGGAGSNGPWDVLPEGWGAGIPIARIARPAWEYLRGIFSGVAYPALRLGWDGKPVHLRSLLEEQLLGPLGVFLFEDEAGLISVGMVGELYPGQTWPAILESDLLADDDGPLVRVRGQLPDTLAGVTWSTNYDADDKAQRVIITRSVQVAEREQDGAQDLEIEVRGVRDLGFAEAACQSVVQAFCRWWTTPYPRLTVTVGLHLLATSVTSGVLLTCSWVPNPWTGTRGLTRQPAVVVGRSVDLVKGTIELELILLPLSNLKLWAPSVRVTAWDAVTNTATCAANDYTSSDGTPARDVLAFGVGDLCMVLTGGLDVRSNNVNVAVTAVEPGGVANKLQFSGAFSVAPVASNVIAFLRYSGGTAPAAAWTTAMKTHAVQARQSTGLLPNNDPPVVYGVGA